jgi:hypothetical protein
VDHEKILNCDETELKILPNGSLTWAQVGADSVSVGAMLNDKDLITALATVTVSRKKLPLCLIAKDVTAPIESSQLGLHP